jgi:hypothetical protein
MSDQLHIAVAALWPSAATAFLILLLAWWPWRKSRNPRLERMGSTLAFGAAFIVGFLHINGTDTIHLRERWHWLLPLGAAATLIALISSASWPSKLIRLLCGIGIAIAAVWLFHPPLALEEKIIIRDPQLWRIVLGGLVLMHWTSLETAASRRPGISMPLVCWILFTGLAVVVLHSEQPIQSLVAATMSIAAGFAILLALLNRNLSVAAGTMQVVAAIFPALLVTGCLYNNFSDVPVICYALLAGAPLAIWIGEWPPISRRSAWISVTLRALVVAVPVGLAIVLAQKAALP